MAKQWLFECNESRWQETSLERAAGLFNRWTSQCLWLDPKEQGVLLIRMIAQALDETEQNDAGVNGKNNVGMRLWAKAWKRAAGKWRRRALWLECDNDHQRAIASQVPYLRGRIKDLERQIPSKFELWKCGGGPGVGTKFAYGYWTGADGDLLCVVNNPNDARKALSHVSRWKAVAFLSFFLKRAIYSLIMQKINNINK